MAAKKVLRFKIGDWIVHYFHGVGQVVDIVEKELEGQRETYFRVSTTQIEYWIPVDKANADHIEPIRSVNDFDQAINIISKPPAQMTEPFNKIKKLIYDRWLDGSLQARAALLRDLHGRNSVKELSYDEKEILVKVEKFFINEWMIADPTLSGLKAKQRLTEALATSYQSGQLEKPAAL